MPAILQPPGAGNEHILPVPNPILPYPGFDDPGAPDIIPNPTNPGKILPILDPVEKTDPTIQERVEAMNNYDGSRKGTVAIPPSDSRFDENSHVKYYAKESQEPTLEDYLRKYANIVTIGVGVLAFIAFIRR